MIGDRIVKIKKELEGVVPPAPWGARPRKRCRSR